MYPKRRMYCNIWQNLEAKHKWECGMWLSAGGRHNHCQALCEWLLRNCNPCEECNIRVIMMVCIPHHIPDAKSKKPDAGAARVIYTATRRDNTRRGRIATRREVCNATRRLGNRSRLIHWERVRGSARAARALRNTRVFQMDTRVVADTLAKNFATISSQCAKNDFQQSINDLWTWILDNARVLR